MKNHLVGGTGLAQGFSAQVGQAAAIEDDAARGGMNELEHRSSESGFAAAGFADEAENFTLTQFQSDAVHGFDSAGAAFEEETFFHGEMGFYVFDLEKGFGARRHNFTELSF